MKKQITQEDAKNYLNKLKNNYNLFWEDILGDTPTENQREINDGICNHNKIAIRSCNSSGKTYAVARIILAFLFTQKSIVLTTAPTFRQVKEVLWRDIATAHSNSKQPLGGTVLKTQLQINDDWFALGLSTKHPEKFQGFHSKNILAVIDESSGVDREIFEAIDGNLAGGNAKEILIGNPNSANGYFADAFKDPAFHKIKISCFDTPNFVNNGIKTLDDIKNADMGALKLINGLIEPKWVLDMVNKYGENSNVCKVRCFGEFPSMDDDAIVGVDDVTNAMEREIPKELWQKEEKILGVDPARFGDDKAILVLRQGNYVHPEIIKIPSCTGPELAGRVIAFVNKYAIPWENVKIDGIGVGASCVDSLKERGFAVHDIQVGQKPDSEDDAKTYSNKRALGFLTLANNIKHMQLPKDDDWFQLSNIKYDYNSLGQIRIEAKEKYKKENGNSPDLADALMLTFLSERKGKFFLDLIMDDEDD